ncbi:MAG: YihY/virulence factor BrkB family protein [Elusimicrobiota bacterium]|nr:MAG: YihY/virulence factor BrkB family protein [Elusimicrobiota bacterium]
MAEGPARGAGKAAAMSLLGRRLQGKLTMLPSFAAAMAFYFLVSLVPFLIVVSRGVAAVFHANLAPELLSFLRDVLPPESSLSPDQLAASVADSGRGLATASAVAAVWTASSGLNELTRAVHFLFSDPERPHPGGWSRRGKAFVVLAIWAVAIGLGAVAFVILPLAQGELVRLGAGRLLPRAFASVVRYPAAFAAMFAAFSCTYVFVPKTSPSWRAAFQGAAVAALACSGVSLLFSYLLPKVWHVSMFNGAMSSMLAALVWTYGCAWGVLLGAVWTVRADEA